MTSDVNSTINGGMKGDGGKGNPVNSHTEPTDEGFLSRWSRRKKEVALEEAVPGSMVDLGSTVVDENGQELSPEQAEQKEPTEQERLDALNELTDDDMPDVDTLDESSDYAGFMSSNVSDALRKMALRKLFAGESYNVRDGLDEYDGDYTSFEKLDPSTITSDMKHMIEVEAKRLEEKLALEAEEKAASEAQLEETQGAEDDGIELTEENDDKINEPNNLEDEQVTIEDQSDETLSRLTLATHDLNDNESVKKNINLTPPTNSTNSMTNTEENT